MARGWAEFLGRLRQLAASGQQDPDAAWATFQDLAANSERANILEVIVRIGRVLPEGDRYQLAMAVLKLVAPLEWPPEWIAARQKLAAALDAVVEETDPDGGSSFFALQGAGGDPDMERVSHIVFHSARDLLRRPCPREELRTAALLCNTGMALCLKSYRSSGRTIDAGSAPRPLVDARSRYRHALLAYAEAAADLNRAVGAVLFEGLHAPMEAEL